MKRMNEITLMVIASLIGLVSGCSSSSNNSLVGSPQATAEQQADLLITNARVYSAPGEPASENQTLDSDDWFGRRSDRRQADD